MENKIFDKIKEFAFELGIDNVDSNFYMAFNFTKVKQRAKGSKGCYANSAFATVGDAVIKLYLSEKFFLENDDTETITKNRIEIEKNSALKDVAVKFNLHELAYAVKNQESDQISSDFATLFEAIIGAIFLQCGYVKTVNILKIKFEL